ncbi:MAG: HU family DNA-binding protein [Bacteroidales bacterium]|nr:HU family DNA-binding protein [Bacteroidales bacterium]
MTKNEISKRVAIKTNWEMWKIEQTIEAFFDVVKEAMIKGEHVNIKRFGTFYAAPMKRSGETFAKCKISYVRPFRQEVKEKTNVNDLLPLRPKRK